MCCEHAGSVTELVPAPACPFRAVTSLALASPVHGDALLCGLADGRMVVVPLHSTQARLLHRSVFVTVSQAANNVANSPEGESGYTAVHP